MKSFITRLAGWFNDQRRQALQAVIASATSLLVILGAVTDVQSSALLDLSASGLLAVQGALGLILLRAGDRFTWLNTTGRGVIYSLGGAIGVVGFTFSLWSESASSLILQVATVLASILVGALQMVNAGTLTAAPAASVDFLSTARTVAPLTGLSVAIFAPNVRPESPEQMHDAAAALLAPEHVSATYGFRQAVEMRGRSFDVVLVTVPLTRGLIETFEPNVSASSFDGPRVQYLEVA